MFSGIVLADSFSCFQYIVIYIYLWYFMYCILDQRFFPENWYPLHVVFKLRKHTEIDLHPGERTFNLLNMIYIKTRSPHDEFILCFWSYGMTLTFFCQGTRNMKIMAGIFENKNKTDSLFRYKGGQTLGMHVLGP